MISGELLSRLKEVVARLSSEVIGIGFRGVLVFFLQSFLVFFGA